MGSCLKLLFALCLLWCTLVVIFEFSRFLLCGYSSETWRMLFRWTTSQFSQTFQFQDETPRFNHLKSRILLFSDPENCHIWNLSLCAVWSGWRIMHLHCTVQDINAVFTIFCNFLVPSQNSASFLTIARSSLSLHPLHCWNSEQILDTRVQRCLWGGRVVGHVWIEKKPHKCVSRLLFMIVVFKFLMR